MSLPVPGVGFVDLKTPEAPPGSAFGPGGNPGGTLVLSELRSGFTPSGSRWNKQGLKVKGRAARTKVQGGKEPSGGGGAGSPPPGPWRNSPGFLALWPLLCRRERREQPGLQQRPLAEVLGAGGGPGKRRVHRGRLPSTPGRGGRPARRRPCHPVDFVPVPGRCVNPR